jgi:hypothetical protein
LFDRAERPLDMVSVSPRVERIQNFAASEVGEIAGAMAFPKRPSAFRIRPG